MMAFYCYSIFGPMIFSTPIVDYGSHEAASAWMVPGTFDHNGDAVQ